MSQNTSRHQHLFVIRLWSEAVAPQPAQWRGSVQHIPSGQQIYFTTLADLNDFIQFRSEACVAEATVSPSAAEK